MKFKIIFLAIFISFLNIKHVVCDLPVHCLKHDIVGSWTIHATELKNVKSGHEMKCGHSEPSQEETSYLAKSPFEFTKIYTLELKSTNEAYINIDGKTLQGTWTMVYDEGFNIQFKNFSFFAFSKYIIEESSGNKNFKSQCYSTCVGWYHTINQIDNKWGCYKAVKNVPEPNKITYLNTKNTLNIVEPGAENLNSNLNNFNTNTNFILPTLPEENESQSLINSVMNMQFRSIGDKITFNNFVEKTSDKISNKQRKNFSKLGVGYNLTKRNYKLRGRGRRPTNFISSFLEEQGMTKLGLGLKLDASFNKHALYISKLNTLKKSWNAALHPNFSNMSIRQLNKFAGIPREKIKIEKSEKLLNTRLTTDNLLQNKIKLNPNPKTSVEGQMIFPKNFDWKDKLKSAGSQGNCGSCYVYSTIRMIQARLKIKYDHDVDLSVQHALDCSFYNQGCNGGYPFLVMKFSNEFQLIPEISDGSCSNSSCDINSLPYLYKTTDYKYVGGSYGQCSHKKMMEELYKNGPIVVSFEPDYNFMMYKNGIYHAFDSNTWMEKGLPKPEWQKVDHSVLLIGWGEDATTGEKFWIIQNTWGPSWGEEGFFRMRRGTDEFGIESICEVASPIIIDNRTGKELSPEEFKIKNNSNGSLFFNGKNNSFQSQDTNASIFDVFK